jgi:hypothetical protein
MKEEGGRRREEGRRKEEEGGGRKEEGGADSFPEAGANINSVSPLTGQTFAHAVLITENSLFLDFAAICRKAGVRLDLNIQ